MQLQLANVLCSSLEGFAYSTLLHVASRIGHRTGAVSLIHAVHVSSAGAPFLKDPHTAQGPAPSSHECI